MYGSGVPTGMAVTAAVRKPTLQGHLLARTVFCVAVVGSAVPGTAVRLIGTAATRRAATASTVSAWCALFSLQCGKLSSSELKEKKRKKKKEKRKSFVGKLLNLWSFAA